MAHKPEKKKKERLSFFSVSRELHKIVTETLPLERVTGRIGSQQAWMKDFSLLTLVFWKQKFLTYTKTFDIVTWIKVCAANLAWASACFNLQL